MGNSLKRKNKKSHKLLSTKFHDSNHNKQHDASTCNNEASANILETIVYGYLRIDIENKMKLPIPKEIQHTIYTFFGYFINVSVGDTVEIKSLSDGKWYQSIVKFNKLPSEAFPPHKQLQSKLTESQSNQIHLQALFVRPQLEPKHIKVGAQIDCRDRWGKWYQSKIMKYKKANKPMPRKAKLTRNQEQNILELQKFDAVYIHYLKWEEKWDEWIFRPSEKICNCDGIGVCEVDKHMHRFAVLETETSEDVLQAKIAKRRRYGRTSNNLEDLQDPIIGEWIIVDNDTVCRDRTCCNNESHRIAYQSAFK